MNLYECFYKPFFSETPYYRPLLIASFIIDYQLWGTKPFGYHFTNLLLHISNALLVYLFILILLKRSELALLASLIIRCSTGGETIKMLYVLSQNYYQKALDSNPENNEVRNKLNDLFL